MKDEKYIPYKRTRDYGEALILASAGSVLDGIEWDYAGRIGTFLFEDASKCEDVLKKHKRKDLFLKSQDVLSAYREVKNLLYKK